MKKLYFVLKRVIISSFILYGYNFISSNFNLILPINFISVFTVSVLGSSGLFGLVLFRYLFLWGEYERRSINC